MNESNNQCCAKCRISVTSLGGTQFSCAQVLLPSGSCDCHSQDSKEEKKHGKNLCKTYHPDDCCTENPKCDFYTPTEKDPKCEHKNPTGKWEVQNGKSKAECACGEWYETDLTQNTLPTEKDPVERCGCRYSDKDGHCIVCEFGKTCNCHLNEMSAENVQSWGERFEKLWVQSDCDGGVVNGAWTNEKAPKGSIKQFISTEIQRAVEKEREENIENWYSEGLITKALASERTKLRAAVEGLRKYDLGIADFYVDGWNQALDKVRDLLK